MGVYVGFLLSLVISVAGGINIENDGLHRIREQAAAMKSNIKVIGGRIENILLQLDPVVERQMKHEEDVYLKASRNDSKKYRHLRPVKKEPLLDYYEDPTDEQII